MEAFLDSPTVLIEEVLLMSDVGGRCGAFGAAVWCPFALGRDVQERRITSLWMCRDRNVRRGCLRKATGVFVR